MMLKGNDAHADAVRAEHGIVLAGLLPIDDSADVATIEQQASPTTGKHSPNGNIRERAAECIGEQPPNLNGPSPSVAYGGKKDAPQHGNRYVRE